MIHVLLMLQFLIRPVNHTWNMTGQLDRDLNTNDLRLHHDLENCSEQRGCLQKQLVLFWGFPTFKLGCIGSPKTSRLQVNRYDISLANFSTLVIKTERETIYFITVSIKMFLYHSHYIIL